MNDNGMVTPFDNALSRFDSEIDKYTDVGSGWKVDSINSVRLHTATYNPIGGSSHMSLPKWIEV